MKNNQKRIKAIIFDLDNTLFEDTNCQEEGLKSSYQVFKKEYFKVKKKNITYKKFSELYHEARKMVHKEHEGTADMHQRSLYFKRLVDKHLGGVKASLIIKLHDVYWYNFLTNMKLREGVIDFFKDLKKKKIKIAIASNLTARIQLIKIKKLKLEKYVDVLVTSEEASSEKPHAIMFLLTLSKLGVSAKETVMVGDDFKADIQGAKDFGMRTILINKDGKKKKKNKADHVIKNFKEIEKIIDEL